MKRRITYKKRSQNRLAMILAVTVMLIILIAVGIRGISLRAQLSEYNERKAELQQQIADEEERTKEIEEYGKYTQTDAYVEEVAREKLGLVKENEIIFRNEDAN